MASIRFIPANLGNQSAAVIESADFEGGFTFSVNENVVSFRGSWINPAPMATNTETLIDIDGSTGNCAVVIAAFQQGPNGYSTINGTMTVSTPATSLSQTGIANAVAKGAKTIGYQYISAPFLLGYLDMSGF